MATDTSGLETWHVTAMAYLNVEATIYHPMTGASHDFVLEASAIGNGITDSISAILVGLPAQYLTIKGGPRMPMSAIKS